MVYARQVLIPVNTDLVSVSGAGACLQFCETLSKAIRTKISAVALLPTMVDRRIGLTKIVGHLLSELSSRYAVPILSEIRTDASVGKATRARQFLVDFDHRSKALEDYKVVAEQLLGILTEANEPAVDPTSDSLLVADVKE
jgi:cellulose biosynthesis protein BcsQ